MLVKAFHLHNTWVSHKDSDPHTGIWPEDVKKYSCSSNYAGSAAPASAWIRAELVESPKRKESIPQRGEQQEQRPGTLRTDDFPFLGVNSLSLAKFHFVWLLADIRTKCNDYINKSEHYWENWSFDLKRKHWWWHNELLLFLGIKILHNCSISCSIWENIKQNQKTTLELSCRIKDDWKKTILEESQEE